MSAGADLFWACLQVQSNYKHIGRCKIAISWEPWLMIYWNTGLSKDRKIEHSRGSLLLDAGFWFIFHCPTLTKRFFASVVLWLRDLSQGMSPLLNWVIFSVKMTGIALLPVKGDVRPLYGYISWGLALQGLMLPRTVSIGGNPSALRQAKKPRVQATFTMWILLCREGGGVHFV